LTQTHAGPAFFECRELQRPAENETRKAEPVMQPASFAALRVDMKMRCLSDCVASAEETSDRYRSFHSGRS
jgi:hypothetical protein